MKEEPNTSKATQSETIADIIRRALAEPPKKKRAKGLLKRNTAYRTAIITYIDILGFKNIVQTRSAAEVHHLLDRFLYELRPDEFDRNQLSVKFLRFSDCLVRAVFVPADDPTGPDGLVFWELFGLVLAQLNLLWRDVIVRGAVTVGELFCAPGTVFGPGLVRAYELEQKAVYPRIIIDPDLLRTLKHPPFRSRDHSPSQDLAYIEGFLSSDEHAYLDYFKALLSNRDDDEQVFHFLKHHRDLVKQGLHEHSKHWRVQAKYFWMAKQHNAFLATLKNSVVHHFGLTKRELRA